MKELKDYLIVVMKGQLEIDIVKLLNAYDYDQVASHSMAVATEAQKLCQRFGTPADSGKIAGLLHDISVIIPTSERVLLCQSLGLVVYQAERELPMILHQRLSKAVAQELFQIRDVTILNAIECHTTLRQAPSQLDLILFVADKIQWDQVGEPPYLAGLLTALETSLEQAALYYIDWLLGNGIQVKHPWLIAAENWLIFERKKR